MEQILLTESDLLIEDICEMLFADAEPYFINNADKSTIFYKTDGSKWEPDFSYNVIDKRLFISYDTLKLIHKYIPEDMYNIIRGIELWFSDKYNKKVRNFQVDVTNEELQLTKEEYRNSRENKYVISGTTFMDI